MEWNLNDKISAVVIDNTVNIIKIILRHVPCFAHKLSLAVNKAVLKN